MKKIVILFLVLISFTIFSATVLSTPNTCLYLLNWGEYINEDLVDKFEKEYNCQVIEENVTSSEIMYQMITNGKTKYDVAIPGDYTVRQLYKEGYLLKIVDDNPLYNNINNYETIFTDSLKDIMDEYMVDDIGNSISEYYMPYFWGAYSIIYSNKKADVEDVVLNNGFKALWDRSLYTSTVNIGMYDTARWIVSSYLMSNNLNPNITDYTSNVISNDLNENIKNDVINALKNNKFNEFGNDSLKRNVANGTLDMCYTQLGDFFDALYLVYEGDNPVIDFNVSVPNTTAAFFDSMVIPKTSKNTELARKFINFMLDKDNAYENATNIGYCPTLKAVCDIYNEAALNGEYYYINEDTGVSLTMLEFLNKYPVYLDPLYNSTNVFLLEPKSNDYLTTCETIFNKLA